jgi:hypothetical protein
VSLLLLVVVVWCVGLEFVVVECVVGCSLLTKLVVVAVAEQQWWLQSD